MQSAEVNGTITDTVGRVLVGATVTATDTATGISRSVTTNESGAYVITGLSAGPYSVTVTSLGFSKVNAEFTLDVNQKATLDLTLKVGQVSEQVSVAADTTALQTSTAQLGTVVTPQQVVDLPLNGRNFSQLLTLTPNVSPVNTSQAGGRVLHIGQPTFPSLSGQSNRSVYFTMDGVYDNMSNKGGYATAPNPDMISEFKVQQHSDDAQFGGAMGGVINVITKSGTNEYHGDAYWFIRNDAFDARTFLLPATAKKGVLRQDQYGATLGAPIKHNKIFWFGAFEGYHYVSPSQSLYLVPSPAELSGDFSADVAINPNFAIYDPQTTTPIYGNPATPTTPTGFTRTQFPGNKIPSNRLDPAIQAWAKLVVPAPVNTGQPSYITNAIDNYPTTEPAQQWNGRFDYKLSDKDSVWGRFTHDWQNNDFQTGYATQHWIDDLQSLNSGAGYTHIFSPNTVVNLLFGFASVGEQRHYYNLPAGQNLMSLFPGLPAESQVTAPALLGADAENDDQGPNLAWQYHADVVRQLKSHTLQFGGEYVFEQNSNNDVDESMGFSSNQTGNPQNPSTTGYNFASFVLGVPSNYTLKQNRYKNNFPTMDAYVQDSWRATSKLTVNIGLRWDAALAPTFPDNNGLMNDWNFNNGTYLVGANSIPTCNGSTVVNGCFPNANDSFVKSGVTLTGKDQVPYRNDLHMLGPRFGVAYKLTPTMVVRGGFAIFFDREAGILQEAQNIVNAWPYLGIANSPSGYNSYTTSQYSVYNTVEQPNGGISLWQAASNPLKITMFAVDPNRTFPYSQQWNLAVEKELTGTLSMAVSYVGSESVHTMVGGGYNTSKVPELVVNLADPNKPFPNLPVSSWDRTWGTQSYESLQAKLEQRPWHGLGYLVAYTWSKALTVSDGQFGTEGESLENPYVLNSGRGPANYNIPHYFSTAMSYKLPFGPGRQWVSSGVAGHLVGNWQVNGIFIDRSGTDFSISGGGDLAHIGGGDGQRANLIGSLYPDQKNAQHWFNKSSFVAPPSGTFGTSGRNILIGPSYNNVDASLFRVDPIGDHLKSEFRVEAFDALNHPILGNPNTTLGSAQMGTISTRQNTARQVQFSLKLLF